MVTTVKTRPTHYEVLGLTPDASSDEVAQAFARELRGPRPFGSLAEVTVAFETLRDAAKRRAYDAALAPKPELKPEPLKFSPKAPAAWAPFVARPSVAELPPIPRAPASAQPEKPHPLLDRLNSPPSPAPRASMPEPIRPETSNPEPRPRIDPGPQPEPEYRPDPLAGWEAETHRAFHFFEDERGRDGLIHSIKWNVPAFAVGCLLLSVLVGAWTGLSAGGDDQPDQPQRFARLKIASAEPRPEAAPELLTETPAQFQLPQPAARTTSTLPRQRVASVQRRVEAAAVQEAELEANVAAEATAEPVIAEATPAKLPLPNAVIARTIGRIGYPCGSVASAASLGGGSYKVTCTSGHSYRAAPVNGRYRFKQLG